MSSGFTEPFKYYVPPDDNTVKTAITSGLVVFDTNVLLSAYRFAPAAREELLSALERIEDRIWVPNRVAEEFHKRRLGVISEYDAAYLPVIETLRAIQEQLDSELQPKIAQLANRAALSDLQRNELIDLVTTSTESATSAAENLRSAHGLPDLRENDTILTRLQQLFNNKTGPALSEKDLEEAIAEAKRRADDLIPPGYRDAKSPEPYGDYLIWKQTLLEAARQQVSFLVFVTSDNKDDWYQIIKGKTISARPELVRELMVETDAQLVMMNTTSFLFHAREYLNAEVSQETIRQSEALPRSGQVSEFQTRSERRGKEREARDLEKLAERVRSRRAEIAALEAAITDRRRVNPEDDSDEINAMRTRLKEVRFSETILARRLGRIEASRILEQEDEEEDEETSDTIGISTNRELLSMRVQAARAVRAVLIVLTVRSFERYRA